MGKTIVKYIDYVIYKYIAFCQKKHYNEIIIMFFFVFVEFGSKVIGWVIDNG